MKGKTRKQFQAQAFRQRQAAAMELMPWDKVTATWNETSGERISITRVQQIAARAEQKVKAAVYDMAQQFFRD